MDIFLLPETWVALATLTLLEIILGVDNIIFISILSNKLPEKDAGKARTIGLILALGLRIGLLFGITQLTKLEADLFAVFGYGFSTKDLILLGGGLFLIAKSTSEIRHKMEGQSEDHIGKKTSISIGSVIAQIIAMDLIFSIDSILTAVGLAEHFVVMIIAVILAMIVMIGFAGSISRFISKHPSLEILALSFLILIGFMLSVEAFDVHVEKKFIYFALFFSLVVEFINMKRSKSTSKPVVLNKRIAEEPEA